MKKLFSTIAIFTLLLLSACSGDSNSSNTDPVEGQWKLVNVSGTFAGVSHDFAAGMITWDFNPITQTVTVVNNNTNPDLWDVLETGVYNYQLVNDPESPCGESIKIDGVTYGCYTVTNEGLIIDQSVADGMTITLKP